MFALVIMFGVVILIANLWALVVALFRLLAYLFFTRDGWIFMGVVYLIALMVKCSN